MTSASGYRGADGKEMERDPRFIDVTVERPPGETLGGRNGQLGVAERLKGRAGSGGPAGTRPAGMHSASADGASPEASARDPPLPPAFAVGGLFWRQRPGA